MLTIPILAVASQRITVTLGGQQCTIKIYQKPDGLFFDLSIGTRAVVTGMIARDRVVLVRHSYLRFNGSIFFVDTLGTLDPYYTELGTRYKLVYAP